MPIIIGGAGPSGDGEFPLDLPTRTYLGDSGIVLGNGDVADADGCRWRRVAKNAWGNKPTPREQVGDRPYDDGQWDATKYYDSRTIPITGHCLAPSHSELHQAEQRLRDAVGIGRFRLRVTEPGYDSFAVVRQSGELLWSEVNRTVASFSFSVFAADPLIYSMLERAFSLGFPNLTGGLTRPATRPATRVTTGDTGRALLSNPGALPRSLQLRIDGPADTVSIGFPEQGERMDLENPVGPLLGAGEYMTVDTARRQVLLMGQSSRRSWWTGTWLQLPPKASTFLAVNGAGTTDDVSGVSGTYRAARI